MWSPSADVHIWFQKFTTHSECLGTNLTNMCS